MERAVLLREVANMRQRNEARIEADRISAAIRRVSGHNWQELAGASPVTLGRVIRGLKASLARERWRGLSRHHQYDLGRHIDLKKALDMTRSLMTTKNGAEAPF